jgi:hypothetical protein
MLAVLAQAIEPAFSRFIRSLSKIVKKRTLALDPGQGNRKLSLLRSLDEQNHQEK